MSPHCQVHRAAAAVTPAPLHDPSPPPTCSAPGRHPHHALSLAVTEPSLSSGSCWESVMCAMFCKAQGLKTSLQSARERRKGGITATSILNNVRMQCGLQGSYWNSSSCVETATFCCLPLQSVLLGEQWRVWGPGYRWLPTKAWSLSIPIARQERPPAGFLRLLDLTPIASGLS